LFGLMEWVLFKPVIRSYDRLSALFAGIKERLAGMRAAESSFVNKHWKLLLAFVLIFALGVRLYGLAQPPSFYFDEIYHSFTGVEYAKGNPDAWMWNSTAPKDRAYDWVQPPTAKILMAVGVSLFGERPIGWRISGALLGFGAVVFVYLIGMALFNNQLLSLLAAALFSLDGLPLTLARVGTNDSVFLFFTLGTVYFFIKNNYLLSSIFMGLAASTKLSAIWLPPLVVLLFFILRKKWEWRLAWFLLPPVIYLLTYAPFFIQGHTVADFGELQKQMVLYHANLKATHPFGSPWWSWPFMLTPIWFYHHEDGGIFTNIYAHGNPVIFWIGLLALIVAVASAVLSKRREVWALIIAYAGMFMPWSLSPRIMFLYHYLPSVPFLCLILAWALTSNRHWRKWTVGFFIVALLVFAYFLPRFIGLPVPQEFSDLYYKILPVVQFFK